MGKKAFITGITGQDGSYLAELLVGKGYEVTGFMRRTSTDPLQRIEDLYTEGKINLIYGNMRDLPTITHALEAVVPDEIYNLAAQSHVGVSFMCPDETYDVDYKGVERILAEAFRVNPEAHFYQASSSEMFGSTPPPQNEASPMNPVSPYAEAKFKAHQLVGEYRAKGFFAVSGILFNHESPRRGKHFVTRKLTHALAKVKLGLLDKVLVGNLAAKRDWGFAGDYVEMMWRMLQAEKPDDYVIATGESHTVRELAEAICDELGMPIHWEGSGLEERGVTKDGKVIIEISEKFFRPHEVDALQGDSTKAAQALGWTPPTTFRALVKMMTAADLKLIRSNTEHRND